MHIQPAREDLIELTAKNPFERFPDGRPRVPDDLIERMKLVTTEEAWGVLREHGYVRQFAGEWKETHPGKITVGRAVTAQFLPHRPDYHDAIQQAGVSEGRGKIGGQNSWVIESLQLPASAHESSARRWQVTDRDACLVTRRVSLCFPLSV